MENQEKLLDYAIAKLEEKINCKNINHKLDFDKIIKLIEEKGAKYVPDVKTLRRAWNYRKETTKPSKATKESLAIALNFSGWDDFEQHVERTKGKDPLFDPSSIKVDELSIGQNITLGWPLRKYAKVKYLGDYKFEIVECKGVKKEVGDVFNAKRFGIKIPHLTIGIVYNEETKEEDLQMGFPCEFNIVAIMEEVDSYESELEFMTVNQILM